MIFDDIPAGGSVFVDANTLVYYSTRHPLFGQPCRSLIERIGRGEIIGHPSTHALSEVAHRAMTIEATTKFGWPAAGIAPRLNRHPLDVMKLSDFRQAVEDVLNGPLQVLTVAPALVANATMISQQTGLLHNDTLIVAVMRAYGLTNLASHDADFDRVPGLNRFAPA